MSQTTQTRPTRPLEEGEVAPAEEQEQASVEPNRR